MAATLISGPAAMSTAWVQASASGEGSVLTSAMEVAPAAVVALASATISGLLPDCETARAAALSSFSFAP